MRARVFLLSFAACSRTPATPPPVDPPEVCVLGFTEAVDLDADGVFDSISDTDLTASGDPSVVRLDQDGDGIVDLITTFTYDGERLLEVSRARGDVLEQREVFTYDGRGLLVLRELDRGPVADGVVDARFLSTWDESGAPATESVDDPAGGDLESTTTFTVDAAGRVVFEAFDLAADGTVEITHSYVYDAGGLLLETADDVDADGVADTVTTFTYDDDGLLASSTLDANDDGVAELTVVYSRDDEGREVLVETEFTGDGVPDRRDVTVYDAEGRVASREQQDGAGAVVRREIHTYDGDTHTVDHDEGGDGAVDARVVTTTRTGPCGSATPRRRARPPARGAAPSRACGEAPLTPPACSRPSASASGR